MKNHLTHPIFKTISEESCNLGQDSYVIGGFVRDLFLCKQSKDIDIVTIGSGISLAEKVATRLGPKVKVSVFKNFGKH